MFHSSCPKRSKSLSEIHEMCQNSEPTRTEPSDLEGEMIAWIAIDVVQVVQPELAHNPIRIAPCAFDAADSGGQFRAGVGGFIGEPPHGG